MLSLLCQVESKNRANIESFALLKDEASVSLYSGM